VLGLTGGEQNDAGAGVQVKSGSPLG
jgi:hypothetical protein